MALVIYAAYLAKIVTNRFNFAYNITWTQEAVPSRCAERNFMISSRKSSSLMIRNALTFAIAVMLASFASARADTQDPQQTSPQSTVLPGMSSAPQPTGVDPFQPPSKDPDLQVPVPPLGDSPLSSAEMDTLMNWIAVRASAQQLPYCWRQSYGNGAGAPYTCKEGLERNGLLCYPKCNEGFSGNGPVCWGSCPRVH